MTTIPWYAYLLILFLPLLINTIIGIYIQLYLKRINRQEKNPPWTYKKSLINAVIIGAPMGALTQILLQEALTPYVYMTEESAWRLVIFAAVFSPWLIMFGYSAALWYARDKYPVLYEWLRIRHRPVDDDDYWNDDSGEYTIKNFRDEK